MQRFWSHVIEIAFRRRDTVSRVTLVSFGLVLIVTMLWPPLYESHSKILIEDNRAQLLVSPSLPSASSNQPAVIINPVSEQDLNSELELLTSPDLVEQALDGLTPPVPAAGLSRVWQPMRALLGLVGSGYRALHDTPEPSAQESWATKLSANLSSWVIKRSNVIEVGFQGHDPRWCQEFLNRLLQHYLDYHARLSQDPQAERFFQEQASLLQHKLSMSEQRLRALQIQTGISNLAEQKSALIRALTDFESHYRTTDAELAAAEERIAALQQQLRTNPERVTKETRVVQNLALQTLKPQVLALESERAELLSRYRPDSERIREIDAKLNAAKTILARENHSEVQESSTDLNPAWESIDTQLADAKVTRAALGANRQELEKQIALYREELKALATDGISIEEASRQVSIDQEAYLSYVRKSEEARAAGALNQSKILNVSIAEPPSMPLRPVFPNLMLNLALGAALALGLGLAAAWWEERRDQRLFSVLAIYEASGLATVAALPEGF